MNREKIINSTLRNELRGITKALEKLSSKGGSNALLENLLKGYLKGEDGHTPVKGVDYLTDKEIESFIKKITENLIGIKLFNEKVVFDKLKEQLFSYIDSRNLLEEKKFKLFEKKFKTSESDLETRFSKKLITLKQELRDEIKESAGIDVKKAEAIARGLEKLIGKEKLSAKAIKGLPNPLTFVNNYSTGGGVGGGYTVETPSGSVNSSNQSFTVTVAPVYIVSDGVAYFEGAGYSRSGLNITMVIPPSSFIRSFYS